MALRKSRRRKRFLGDAYRPMLDYSQKYLIIDYVIHLLQEIDPDEKLLTLAIDCLEMQARYEFIESVYLSKCRTTLYEDEYGNNDYEQAQECINNSTELANIIISLLYDTAKTNPWKIIKQSLIKLLHKEKEISRKSIDKHDFDSRLEKLADIFVLTEEDIKVLRLWAIALGMTGGTLKDVLTEGNFTELKRRIAIAVQLPVTTVRFVLSMQGLLYTSQIIKVINPEGYEYIVLSDEIIDFLYDIGNENVLERYVKYDTEATFALTDFSVSPEDKNIVCKILQSGRSCNIFLYGAPGTGKTEFARTIAHLSNRKVYVANTSGNENSRSESLHGRLMAITIAIKIAEKNNAVLIIDEADALLNSESFFFTDTIDKGRINDVLDKSRAQCIWIANKTSHIAGSTLRRFAYNIQFEHFGQKQRFAIWQKVVGNSALGQLITDDVLYELSNKYIVNAAGIATSIHVLETIYAQNLITRDEIVPMLHSIVKKHASLVGITSDELLLPLTRNYDVTLCNTDTDLESVVKLVKNFSTGQTAIHNLSLLLWGQSGTGKTEFVKYLAQQAGKKLIIKRASDLMSMFVGETEMLIRQAFHEASEEDAILFIDEADSFFLSRNRAHHSWEITRVNEMLVQMENYKGILVCATNLLALLDTAVMRRFNFKIKFDALTREKRVALYERYFVTDDNPLLLQQKQRIEALEGLTCGHIKAVHQRAMLFGKMCDHEYCIDELEKEIQYANTAKPSKAGFAV